MTKVLNIMRKLLPPFLSKRKILNILKDRKNVILPLIADGLYAYIMIPKAETKAITKLKMFQPSLIYTLSPVPIIMIRASRTNIAVKI
jgi:hypothetical protein